MLFVPKLRGAACADVDPITAAAFFASGAAYKLAVKVCETCPVTEDCLREALAHETPGERRYGVVGGLTAAERARRSA